MEENKDNRSPMGLKSVISNPGTTMGSPAKPATDKAEAVAATTPDPEPTSKDKKEKTLKSKKNKFGSASELVTTRLSGLPYSGLTWALGIMMVGAIWFAFDKDGYNIGGFALSTAWIPKLTATIALIIVVMMAIKLLFNWRQFKKTFFVPYSLAHLAIIPIIIIVFGEVLLQSTTSTSDGLWYAGLVFYAIGILATVILMCWYIYISINYFIKQKNSLSELNGAYIIPLSGLGFALYTSKNLTNEATVLLWIFWVVTLVLGGFGTVVLIYRYLAMGRKNATTLQTFGYIVLPVSLLLLGFANIRESAETFLNAHEAVFLFVLLGLATEGMIGMYILMYKNACLCTDQKGVYEYSTELSNSLLPLAVVAVATTQFAAGTLYGYELAQYAIVQLTIISAFLLYTGAAGTTKFLNSFFQNPEIFQFKNPILKAYF